MRNSDGLIAQIWVTSGTPTMPSILNRVTAACDQGYVPDEVWVLSNPGVAKYVTEVTNRFEGNPQIRGHKQPNFSIISPYCSASSACQK